MNKGAVDSRSDLLKIYVVCRVAKSMMYETGKVWSGTHGINISAMSAET